MISFYALLLHGFNVNFICFYVQHTHIHVFKMKVHWFKFSLLFGFFSAKTPLLPTPPNTTTQLISNLSLMPFHCSNVDSQSRTFIYDHNFHYYYQWVIFFLFHQFETRSLGSNLCLLFIWSLCSLALMLF